MKILFFFKNSERKKKFENLEFWDNALEVQFGKFHIRIFLEICYSVKNKFTKI